MIYLDHAATTPLASEVREAMLPWLDSRGGNPSSLHQAGRESRHAVEQAREKVAAAIGATSREIVFTSGGTEGDSLAVLGTARARSGRGRHVVTSAIEHHAVLHSFRQLEREGFAVTRVRPDAHGRVSVDAVLAALRPETQLVSLMHANNETGVLQPVEELALKLRERGIAFHVDAVQSFGKVPFDVRTIGGDLATFSAHKINGPKGSGAVYLRLGTIIESLQYGGGSEFGWRPGTENVAGIVGFAAAAERATARLNEWAPRIALLRAELEAGLRERIPGMIVNGAGAPRVCNVLNVSFPGIDGEMMLLKLDARGICVSTGAACNSGDVDPSHVLLSMGLPREHASAAIRFSMGSENTPEEIDRTIRAVAEEATKRL